MIIVNDHFVIADESDKIDCPQCGSETIPAVCRDGLHQLHKCSADEKHVFVVEFGS